MVWFLISEKIRFIVLASFVMAVRFLIFLSLGILFSTKHYQIILAFTWIISSVFAFLLYKHLVFVSSGSHFKQYLKSLLIWGGSYVINIFSLNFLVENLKISVYWAEGVIILFLLITNYLLFKNFAFKS